MASTRGSALPGAAAGAVAGAGTGGAGGSSVTIYVGSDFEDSPRAGAQRLRRAFDRARDMEGGDNSIVINE